MNNRNSSLLHTLATVLGLIALGALGRLAPHLPNATPLTALIRASRARLGTAWSVAIPLVTLVLTDAALGFYDWRMLVSVYGSFLCIALLNSVLDHSYRDSLFLGTVGSLFFFLSTNAAVWAFSPWYAHTLSGLMEAYLLGLPFFAYMVIGDLCYLTALHLLPTIQHYNAPWVGATAATP